MKSKCGRVSRSLIVAVVLLGAVAVLFSLFVVRPIRREAKASRERLVHLLCETDYEALLTACRDLSNRVAEGRLQPGTYGVRRGRAHEVSHFPEAILAIQPAFVRIMNDGRVFVEMFGLPSYGAVAYPEGYELGTHHAGDVELVPGLWYYDEDYDRYTDRQRDIDALVERGRQRLNE